MKRVHNLCYIVFRHLNIVAAGGHKSITQSASNLHGSLHWLLCLLLISFSYFPLFHLDKVFCPLQNLLITQIRLPSKGGKHCLIEFLVSEIKLSKMAYFIGHLQKLILILLFFTEILLRFFVERSFASWRTEVIGLSVILGFASGSFWCNIHVTYRVFKSIRHLKSPFV